MSVSVSVSVSHLCQYGAECCRPQQTAGRPPSVEPRGRRRVTHQHSHTGGNHQINVEELHVAQVTVVLVQQQNGDKLDDTVQSHVLERAEAGGERAPALAHHGRNARDVRYFGGEGSCD